MNLLNKVTKFGSKHGSELMTGLAIIGLVKTVYDACKSTPKALRVLEDEEKEKIVTEGRNLTRIEKCKILATEYGSTIVWGILTSSCIIGSNVISNKQKKRLMFENAALMTSYTTTRNLFDRYKKAVAETVEENSVNKIQDYMIGESLKDAGVINQEIVQKYENDTQDENTTHMIESSCDIWFVDGRTGRPFKSSIQKIDDAINEINNILNNDHTATVSDLYDLLGLDHTDDSDYLGWNRDRGLIHRDKSEVTRMVYGIPCVVFSVDKPARYEFDVWSY